MEVMIDCKIVTNLNIKSGDNLSLMSDFNSGGNTNLNYDAVPELPKMGVYGHMAVGRGLIGSPVKKKLEQKNELEIKAKGES